MGHGCDPRWIGVTADAQTRAARPCDLRVPAGPGLRWRRTDELNLAKRGLWMRGQVRNLAGKGDAPALDPVVELGVPKAVNLGEATQTEVAQPVPAHPLPPIPGGARRPASRIIPTSSPQPATPSSARDRCTPLASCSRPAASSPPNSFKIPLMDAGRMSEEIVWTCCGAPPPSQGIGERRQGLAVAPLHGEPDRRRTVVLPGRADDRQVVVRALPAHLVSRQIHREPNWIRSHGLAGVVRRLRPSMGSHGGGCASVVSHKWLVFRREGFSCPTRRERRADPKRCVRSEPRRGTRKEPRPFGWLQECPGASCFVRPGPPRVGSVLTPCPRAFLGQRSTSDL